MSGKFDETQRLILINHAQWLIERLEKTAEGISSRAGILLGASGVELGIIINGQSAQISKVIAAFGLVVTGGFLTSVIWPIDVEFPKSKMLLEVYGGKRNADLEAITELIGWQNPKSAMFEQYMNEVQKRGKRFQKAIIIFSISQALFLLTFWR
jgi:hypothetical protein